MEWTACSVMVLRHRTEIRLCCGWVCGELVREKREHGSLDLRRMLKDGVEDGRLELPGSDALRTESTPMSAGARNAVSWYGEMRARERCYGGLLKDGVRGS